jgi:hypothetical protein
MAHEGCADEGRRCEQEILLHAESSTWRAYAHGRHSLPNVPYWQRYVPLCIMLARALRPLGPYEGKHRADYIRSFRFITPEGINGPWFASHYRPWGVEGKEKSS